MNFEIGEESIADLRAALKRVQEHPDFEDALGDLVMGYLSCIASGDGADTAAELMDKTAAHLVSAVAFKRLLERTTVVRVEEFPGTAETLPEPEAEKAAPTPKTYADMLRESEQ